MNVWIEKTEVKGQAHRQSGDRALGKVLWSPTRSKDGKDIYKNMKLVKPGDLVLHLVDDESIVGVSRVAKMAVEADGIVGSKWEGPAYLVKLKDYKELNPTLLKSEFLKDKRYSAKLNKFREDGEVFFDKDFNLRQGAYLTLCIPELFNLLNKIYKTKAKNDLPYFEMNTFSNESKFEEEIISVDSFLRSLNECGLVLRKDLLVRLIASALAKPFVILTGLSGSGKTKLAQAFAMWLCEEESQYKLVPVGADWTSREPLLGFPNGLEKSEYIKSDTGVLELLIEASKPENSNKPYFLLLDEMNHSHVERYFADFLSVMESEDKIKLYDGKQRSSSDGKEIPKEIAIPKNLFVIGTVNIDETTYMFSPKVLDRANVIEFRVSKEDMDFYLQNYLPLDMPGLKGAGASQAESFLALSEDKTLKADKESLNQINTELILFFDELQKVGAEFGFRSAGEILRFAAIVKKLDSEWNASKILDAAIMQKLLPKVHGSRRKLEPVLKKLAALCINGDANIDELITKDLTEENSSIIKYPLSFEKIRRMYSNLLNNGFTSYAEA